MKKQARFADPHWSQFHDFTSYRVIRESNLHYWQGITVILQWLMALHLMHYSSHCIPECFEINYRHTPSLLKYIF